MALPAERLHPPSTPCSPTKYVYYINAMFRLHWQWLLSEKDRVQVHFRISA